MTVEVVQTFELGDNRTIPLIESKFTYYLNKLDSDNATNILTFSGNAQNNEVVIIGGKTYTFVTSLATVNGQTDGKVLIDTTSQGSRDNLIAAIMLDPGAGVIYGFLTTLSPTVIAEPLTGDRMEVFAKIAGPAGNAITSTETLATGEWAAITLQNGTSGPTNQDNNFVLNLSNAAFEGIKYKFVTQDNGITVVDNREYFTQWDIVCELPQKFIVSGAPGGFRKVLKTEQNFPFDTEVLKIGLTRTQRGKNFREGYIAGATLELTFFNGAWRGSAFTGPSVRGVGDI